MKDLQSHILLRYLHYYFGEGNTSSIASMMCAERRATCWDTCIIIFLLCFFEISQIWTMLMDEVLYSFTLMLQGDLIDTLLYMNVFPNSIILSYGTYSIIVSSKLNSIVSEYWVTLCIIDCIWFDYFRKQLIMHNRYFTSHCS